MLAKRKKGRSQRVALLEAFALRDAVANVVLVPPEEFGGGAVPGARERDKGRCDFKQFVENGRPADGVVSAAAIHGHGPLCWGPCPGRPKGQPPASVPARAWSANWYTAECLDVLVFCLSVRSIRRLYN